MVLDVIGMIPGIGDVADAINGVLCLARGNFLEAGLSFIAIIPLVGDAFKGLKYVDKAENLLKYGDKVVGIGKSILKQGTEKAGKVFKKGLETLIGSGNINGFKKAVHATIDTGKEFIIRGKEGIDTVLTKIHLPEAFNTVCTSGCFLENTEVETEYGLKNINRILSFRWNFNSIWRLEVVI